jgi:hypothetical protein
MKFIIFVSFLMPAIANAEQWDKIAALKAIATQESSSGRNTHHRPLKNGTHCMGVYGLCSALIKEIIINNPKTFINEKELLDFDNDEMETYLNKHIEVQDRLATVAYSHISRLLGTKDPQIIYVAWVNGIERTKRMLTSDIKQHRLANRVMGYYKQMAGL